MVKCVIQVTSYTANSTW